MEILIPVAALSVFALAAVFGADSRTYEPTWPGAAPSGKDARRALERAAAEQAALCRAC
jgi:hypothetical protein